MTAPLTLDDLTIVSAFVDGDGDPEAPNQWPAVRIHIRRKHPMIELTIDEARDLVSAIETAIDQAENPDDDEPDNDTLEARLDRAMRDEP